MKNGALDPAFPTFVEALQAHAATQPEALAFVHLDAQGAVEQQMTYATLDRRARAIAAGLLARGFAGERALLAYPPGLEFVCGLFGCFYAGCVAVSVPLLTARRINDRIDAVVRDAEPACIMKDHDHCQAEWSGKGSAGRSRPCVWLRSDTLPDAPPGWTPPAIAADRLALLQYTSGSTAAPKGVMVTHANLIANSEMIKTAFGHGPELRVVGWLPLFHDMGLVGHVLQPVYLGGLSVLMAPSTFFKRPVRWLEAISTWRATSSGGPTYGFDLCARTVRPDQVNNLDLSAWEIAYCGSEKVDHDVLKRFAAAFRPNGFRESALYPCFGLAEATLLATGGRKGTGVRTVEAAQPTPPLASWALGAAPGSTRDIVNCGHAPAGSRIAIVEPKTHALRNEGEVGEIWIGGPHVGAGYWGRPEDSAETFDARIAGAEDGSWLRTGDLGFTSKGDLFIVGRLKDAIVVRGQNHSPEDIEVSVRESHSACAEQLNAAFPVEGKGEEQIVVVQELRPHRLDEAGIDTIRAAANAGVARDHGLRLEDLVFVPLGSIPRTSSGKVRRAHCRTLYLERRLDALGGLRPAGKQDRMAVQADG